MTRAVAGADPRVMARRGRLDAHPTTRRSLLLSGGCWLLVAGCPSRPTLAARDALAELLRGMFSDPGAARSIGALYLRRHPQEAGRGQLCRALWGESLPRTRTALAGSLAAQRGRELTAGELTIIEGWLMTRSEARLCALIAMTAGAA
jgi:hypothetical protein